MGVGDVVYVSRDRTGSGLRCTRGALKVAIKHRSWDVRPGKHSPVLDVKIDRVEVVGALDSL